MFDVVRLVTPLFVLERMMLGAFLRDVYETGGGMPWSSSRGQLRVFGVGAQGLWPVCVFRSWRGSEGQVGCDLLVGIINMCDGRYLCGVTVVYVS